MSSFKSYSYASGRSPWERLIGSILFLAFTFFLFYLFFQLYKLLWFAVPVLLIISLIMDARVLGSHFKKIGSEIAEHPLTGLLYAVMNLIGLPFVLIGLIFKSWMLKKVQSVKEEIFTSKNSDLGYTSYEEVDSDTVHQDNNIKKKQLADHRYDDLFE